MATTGKTRSGHHIPTLQVDREQTSADAWVGQGSYEVFCLLRYIYVVGSAMVPLIYVNPVTSVLSAGERGPADHFGSRLF